MLKSSNTKANSSLLNQSEFIPAEQSFQPKPGRLLTQPNISTLKLNNSSSNQRNKFEDLKKRLLDTQTGAAFNYQYQFNNSKDSYSSVSHKAEKVKQRTSQLEELIGIGSGPSRMAARNLNS